MANDPNTSQTDPGNPSPYPDGQKDETPATTFKPGELAPFWYSDQPDQLPLLSDEAKKEIKRLCDLVGNKDVAARRWEVEQSWEARLFDRGYQYLLPRKGGGWILPPGATDYSRTGKKGGKFYGYETNIYATYGEIITAALTRDIPEVQWEPKNPESDVDITFAESAEKYSRQFARANDLLSFQHQLVYYLRTDGRAIIVTNHIVDAQRFGRMEPLPVTVVPENEAQEEQALLYMVRHGETPNNSEHVARGRDESEQSQPDQQGQRETANAAEFLKNKGVGKIISSPVARARESADITSKITGAPVEFDDRFASRDIGDLEGKPSEEAGEELSANADNPSEPMPGGGESQDDLDSRVRDGLFSILQHPGGPPPAVLTHDSVISAAFRIFHGDNVPPADLVPTGGVAGVFPVAGGGMTIRPVFPAVTPRGTLPAEKGEPRGEEIVEVYGKLEGKTPINAQGREDCPYVQVSKEYDYDYVKAMFPDHADEIKPGSAGAGENELDRIARINACLALEASYVTGDSMVRDCTVQRTWIRPGWFMGTENVAVREELFKFFPAGMLAIYAGEALCLVRNENMDDHVTIVQAFPGSGMNRLALCSKLLSVQKRVNNWIDLINDYFIRTIPQRIVDVDMYNLEAIQDQPAAPGDYVGVKRQGTQAAGTNDYGIFVEPTPTHQASMPDFINMFLNDLPQLLVGALPSLFGSQSNNDSNNPSSGFALSVQRDQAMGRLATPWHSVQMATCSYFKQAVQLAARCRREPIHAAGAPGEAIKIELSDLKGDVLVFPEDSPDIPESWNQRQARYQALLADAATNPQVAQLLANPANAKLAHDSAGLTGFIIPQAISWDKQLGEFEVLLSGAPVPNPQKIMLEKQVADSVTVGAQQGLQPGPDILQAQQQANTMPDMISTIPVDEKVDDSATESACCANWLNGPEGRKFKNGTQEERDGYANVRLHKIEHDTVAAKNAPKPPMPPPRISANFKDFPSKAKSDVLADEGIQVSPGEIMAENQNNGGAGK